MSYERLKHIGRLLRSLDHEIKSPFDETVQDILGEMYDEIRALHDAIHKEKK